jgi:hypothetical protein
MTDWKIYVKDSNDDWALDETIQRPNDNMDTSIVSTQQKIELADGSLGFIILETKYVNKSFTMFFADTTSAFRTLMTNYIQNNTYIKLVAHTDEYFIGYFTEMVRVWLCGMENTYDAQITLETSE